MHMPIMSKLTAVPKKAKYRGTKPIFACTCKESTTSCKAIYHECTCHISTRNCKEDENTHDCICQLSSAACKSDKHNDK